MRELSSVRMGAITEEGNYFILGTGIEAELEIGDLIYGGEGLYLIVENQSDIDKFEEVTKENYLILRKDETETKLS